MTLCSLSIGASALAESLRPNLPPPKTLVAPTQEIANQVGLRNWSEALRLIETRKENGLLQLLAQKARFELKKWDDILNQKPNQDPLFKDYDDYIRLLALYESGRYQAFTNSKIPSGIPQTYQEYLQLLNARSFAALKDLQPAKKAFRQFLDRHPRTRYRTEAMLELANIEWDLQNRYEALHIYERIYIDHPLNDRDNIASQRLHESGRLESLDASLHLKRIQSFKRSALFSRALKELNQLEKTARSADQEEVRLAIANLEFAQKNYTRSERLARQGLRRTQQESQSLHRNWKSLLAFSLVRQGKYDEAREIYAELLKMNIPRSEKETILRRLGLMAVDDRDFKSAQNHFSQLRRDFTQGSFQESSHWFESWAIIQQFLTKPSNESLSKEMKSHLETASQLLERLPKLSQGAALKGQSLYWRSKVEAGLGNSRKSAALADELKINWGASFYSVLTAPENFQFLFYRENLATLEIISRENRSFKVADPAFREVSWKRLEAFVSVKLYHWAQLELESFMRSTSRQKPGLREAIAQRLEVLGDWSDLVTFAQSHFPLQISQVQSHPEIASFHYPQAYGHEVIKAANEFQVSPFLIWGVMREESRFRSDAVSPAGAVGLLQLMPSLANQIATRLKHPKVSQAQLTSPDVNIRFAVFHLRELIQQIQSWNVKPEFVFPLVVASYNAGAGPVRRWLRESKEAPLDEFIESIPFAETRTYVKRVIQSANIYWKLYGEKSNRIARQKGGSTL